MVDIFSAAWHRRARRRQMTFPKVRTRKRAPCLHRGQPCRRREVFGVSRDGCFGPHRPHVDCLYLHRGATDNPAGAWSFQRWAIRRSRVKGCSVATYHASIGVRCSARSRSDVRLKWLCALLWRRTVDKHRHAGRNVDRTIRVPRVKYHTYMPSRPRRRRFRLIRIFEYPVSSP